MLFYFFLILIEDIRVLKNEGMEIESFADLLREEGIVSEVVDNLDYNQINGELIVS